MRARAASEKRPRHRTVRSPLEIIAVALTAEEVVAHAAWRRRVDAIEERPSRLLRYAAWYPPIRERWVALAAAEGLWRPDDAWEGRLDDSCRRPIAALEHHRADDGTVHHLEVEPIAAGPALVARHCWTGPRIPRVRWTDEQRLSWEELVAGTPCRGCGRGFEDGLPWMPMAHRTPEEAAAFATADAAFRALHPDCTSWRWSISGGVDHCYECCPPPPLGPEQVRRLAPILAEMALSAAERDASLERRWGEAATSGP
jgi:hypothetical protein